MVINTNIAALNAASDLNTSTNALNASLARLSTGSQLVNASDNPAGLAESISLNAQIGESTATSNNVANALSYSQTQDGYLQQVGSALDQMATLATEAQDGTLSGSQLADYNSEFQALSQFITATSTASFNGVGLFTSAAASTGLAVGGTSYTMGPIDMGSDSSQIGILTSQTSGAPTYDLTSTSDATTALAAVNAAISELGTDRATVGASEQYLNYTSQQLGVLNTNLSAANSQISDVDVATESTNYAKYQILTQSGTAMLAQANQNPQNILKLLQGL
jgi:flagellin